MPGLKTDGPRPRQPINKVTMLASIMPLVCCNFNNNSNSNIINIQWPVIITSIPISTSSCTTTITTNNRSYSIMARPTHL